MLLIYIFDNGESLLMPLNQVDSAFFWPAGGEEFWVAPPWFDEFFRLLNECYTDMISHTMGGSFVIEPLRG